MKVVGTGAPRMLTVRFKSCEINVLRDELHHCRAAITEAAAKAHADSNAPGAGAGDREVEDRHDELFLITRVLDELRSPAPRDQTRQIVGPTWLLAPVIRGAAEEAVERLRDAVVAFGADTGSPTPDEVRAAVDTGPFLREPASPTAQHLPPRYLRRLGDVPPARIAVDLCDVDMPEAHHGKRLQRPARGVKDEDQGHEHERGRERLADPAKVRACELTRLREQNREHHAEETE